MLLDVEKTGDHNPHNHSVHKVHKVQTLSYHDGYIRGLITAQPVNNPDIHNVHCMKTILFTANITCTQMYSCI